MSNATSYQLFINGRWRAGSGTLTLANPATERYLARSQRLRLRI
ncbi:hypothetical protein MES5069_450068 [Mesorhizobium escarrei]|uniref:Aldehyde dehydrogenase domain-containing protein n=1 Tax=Mesorhizobium escarrei TaxID=666018 RepID=A0ABN8K6M1_9HYPH|nr:hypothetical protein MES5069_450068 [Mesorhizobium escarrei]